MYCFQAFALFSIENVKFWLFCQESKHFWCTFTVLNNAVVYKNCMPIHYFQWYVCPYLLLYGLSAIGIWLHGSMGFISKKWGDWIDGWYPLDCEDHYRTYGAKKMGHFSCWKRKGVGWAVWDIIGSNHLKCARPSFSLSSPFQHTYFDLKTLIPFSYQTYLPTWSTYPSNLQTSKT